MTDSETDLTPEGRISENLRERRPHKDATPTQESSQSELDPWAAFSLLSNGRKVLSFEHPVLTLQSLYGLKFLSICWVLIGHTCLITGSLPAINYESTRDVSMLYNSDTH
jgi:hypothetical protein